MKKATLALAALAGLAASTAPASAWHRGHPHWRRSVVVAPFPFVAPVYVAPRLVYRAPRTVVYRAPVRRVVIRRY
jgi:hypothetical protein